MYLARLAGFEPATYGLEVISGGYLRTLKEHKKFNNLQELTDITGIYDNPGKPNKLGVNFG
jgi:hypothetical protein